MPNVDVSCDRNFDPPIVRVVISIGGQYVTGFDVPYAEYNDVANALNLPGNPCQGA